LLAEVMFSIENVFVIILLILFRHFSVSILKGAVCKIVAKTGTAITFKLL